MTSNKEPFDAIAFINAIRAVLRKDPLPHTETPTKVYSGVPIYADPLKVDGRVGSGASL